MRHIERHMRGSDRVLGTDDRRIALAGAAGLIGVSCLAVAAGVPTVLSPLPLPSMLAILLTYPVLGRSSMAAGVLLMPVLFWGWMRFAVRPARRREQHVLPGHSIGLAILLFGLQVWWIAAGWNYGMRYQGRWHVHGLVSITGMWAVLLLVLAVAARWRSSARLGLLFHLALFTWLAWYAFPWLGELP